MTLAMKRIFQLAAAGLALGLLVTGCQGIQTAGEKSARQDLAVITRLLQTNNPALTTNATLPEVVLFAVKNHPQVVETYAAWAASVENITIARSLPDLKLTFELDINDAVQAIMPGFMADFPGPGKLRARAELASAEGRAKYFQFESAALQTAFGVEKNFYPLYFLEQKIDVNRRMLALLDSLEILARTQNEVGRATLQDVLRAQIEQEKLKTETANLEDSRNVLMAQYKAALGLKASQPNPPVPTDVKYSYFGINEEQLLANALKKNPRLKEMESEIQVAEAAIRVARKEKIPDFSAGGRADVKANPIIWNPQFSMTLPIWRDKLAAELAAAQAVKLAAEARLSTEQINLAVDFATQAYLIREANRQLDLLRERLLPRARQSLEVARAAYRAGQVDFLNVIDSERTLLDFQLDEIAAQTQREVARAQLILLIANMPPEGAPILKSETAQTHH